MPAPASALPHHVARIGMPAHVSNRCIYARSIACSNENLRTFTPVRLRRDSLSRSFLIALIAADALRPLDTYFHPPSSSPTTTVPSGSTQRKSTRYTLPGSRGSSSSTCSSGIMKPNSIIVARAMDSPPFSLQLSAAAATRRAVETPLRRAPFRTMKAISSAFDIMPSCRAESAIAKP